MWENPIKYRASIDVQGYRDIFDDLIKKHYNVLDINDFLKQKVLSYNYCEPVSWSLISIRLYAELKFEDENGIIFVRELLNTLDDSNILFACTILLNLKLKENETVI